MTGIDWKPLNTGEPVDRFDIKIHFDGKGHTIRNLHCEISSRYASFFGVMNGSCRNVRFENAEVLDMVLLVRVLLPVIWEQMLWSV